MSATPLVKQPDSLEDLGLLIMRHVRESSFLSLHLRPPSGQEGGFQVSLFVHLPI